MRKYTVCATLAFNTGQDVEAETPEEAAECAGNEAYLCHQCASHGDLGDALYITVLDGSGDEVLFEEDLNYHPPCPVCSATLVERFKAWVLSVGELPSDELLELSRELDGLADSLADYGKILPSGITAATANHIERIA